MYTKNQGILFGKTYKTFCIEEQDKINLFVISTEKTFYVFFNLKSKTHLS